MRTTGRVLAFVLAFIIVVGSIPVVLAYNGNNDYAHIEAETVEPEDKSTTFFVSAEALSQETLILEIGESAELTVLLSEDILRVEISSNEDFVLVSPNVFIEDGVAQIKGRDIGESDVKVTFWAVTTPSAVNVDVYNYPNGTQTYEDMDDTEEVIEPIVKTIKVYVIEPVTIAPLSFNGPTFFDDFTVDTLFWDVPIFSMRRYDNRLTTNINSGWARAETRGRQWDNFDAIIDFSITSPHQAGADDFAVFHIRYAAPDNNLAIMIRDNRITVMHNWDFNEIPVAYHAFTRGEMHRLKIQALDENINLFIWDENVTDFVQLNSNPIIHGAPLQPPQKGQIVLRSWLNHIAVDSITIIDTNPHEFYFADAFVRVELGNPMTIAPVNDTGSTIDSIVFSSNKPDVISVDPATGALTAHRQYMGYVTITAIAVTINGDTHTAFYNAVVYAPFDGQASFILHSHHPNHNQLLRVGDTMNLNLFTDPVYVSDVRFDWTTTHPSAMEFVGTNQIQRGIRAIAPATGIIVRATHVDTGLYTETIFDILPRVTTTVNRAFTMDSTASAIPQHFWGVNIGASSIGVIGGSRHREHGESGIRYWQDQETVYLESIQPQLVRFVLEHYESEPHSTGTNIFGIHNQQGYIDSPVSLDLVFRQANLLDVPLFFTTSTQDSAAHKINVISAALEIVDARPLIVTIMNEPHDPTNDVAHMIGRNPPATVQDYMTIVRQVTRAIRARYPGEVIIAVCTSPDAFKWAPPWDIDIPGTLAYRLVGWNEHLALPSNQYYFDAVVMFAYSGAQGPAFFGGVTTDFIMERFSFQAASEQQIIERQRLLFPYKYIWVVEYGDLPIYHFPHFVQNYFMMDEHIRAQWSYMKSFGNAIGYVQRTLGILQHGIATKAIYYSFNHAGSFGAVQANYGHPSHGIYGYYDIIAMPPHYAFRELGRIFNEHTHFFDLTPPADSRVVINDWFGSWAGSYPWTGSIPLDVYRLSGLAFGDRYGAQQAAFVNTSAYAANISIPSYYFRKTWSYGDGSNPLPDFAVNQLPNWAHAPQSFMLPTVHSGSSFSDTLFVPAYSMVVADITKPRTLTSTTANGTTGSTTTTQLTLSFNDDVTSPIRPANVSVIGGGSNVTVDSVTGTGNTRVVYISGTWDDAANITVSIIGSVSGYTITGTQNVILHRNVTAATYPVTVAPSVVAYVSVSPTTAEVGQTITVTITPPTGQRLAASGVTATGVTTFTGNTVGSTSITFTKTAGATEVNATFDNIPPDTFTITFDPNGGTVTLTSGVTDPAGRLATLPTPTKANYNFVGWFTQAIGGAQVTAGATGTVFDANTIIFAQWTVIDNNQGNDSNDQGGENNQNGNNQDSGNNQGSNNQGSNNQSGNNNQSENNQESGESMPNDNRPTLPPTQTPPPTPQPTPQPTPDPIPPPTPTPTPTPQPTPLPIPSPIPPPTPIPLPFADVSTTAWYYPFVRAVWEQQLFQGTSPTTFAPQDNMNRAMFVQALANLENVDLTVYRTWVATFDDTASTAWYFGAVEWAASQGLVSGVGNNNFAPSRPITREEMVVMLNNFIVSRNIVLPQGETSLFTDHDSISAWAIEGVTAIQAAGIISGHPDDRFAPQDTATRAEVATIFARFLEVADLPRRNILAMADDDE